MQISMECIWIIDMKLNREKNQNTIMMSFYTKIVECKNYKSKFK